MENEIIRFPSKIIIIDSNVYLYIENNYTDFKTYKKNTERKIRRFE